MLSTSRFLTLGLLDVIGSLETHRPTQLQLFLVALDLRRRLNSTLALRLNLALRLIAFAGENAYA